MWHITLSVAVMLGITLNGVARGRSILSITGGKEVDIDEFPHQVSLIYNGNTTCGGSIISEEYVLTAAHCVLNKLAEDFQVRVNNSYSTEGDALYNAASIATHPLFNLESEGDYDIAVIKIAGEINIDNETPYIAQQGDSGSELKNGHVVPVMNWDFHLKFNTSIAFAFDYDNNHLEQTTHYEYNKTSETPGV